MTTEFGKVLRKLRVDLDMTLAGLAEKLSVSAAFVSCLETGKKAVPPTFVEKLIERLSLDDEVAAALREAASRTTKKAIVIPLEGRDAFSQKLAVAFARRMERPMTKREKQDLWDLLETPKRK